MITFLIAYNGGLGISPSAASGGKNGAPHAIPRQTLYRWKKHYDWFGETPQETMRRHQGDTLGGKRVTNYVVKRKIKDLLDENPSLYLDEVRAKLHGVFNKWYSVSSIQRCIVRDLHYTVKLLSMKAVQADDMERETYRRALGTVKDPRMFVFLDESSVSKDDTSRRRGRGRKGKPVMRYAVFTGDNQATYTLLGAVDINGFVTDACEPIWRRTGGSNNTQAGTIDTERFLQWVREYLGPTLGNFQQEEPRSVVVLDNAPIHKDPRVVAAIEATGAIVIWCARYSPDLNPIEMCFHQYKAYLRRYAASFVGMPWYLLHHYALKMVTRDNMLNYYSGDAMEGCIDISSVRRKRRIGKVLIAAGIIDANPSKKKKKIRK